MKRIWTLFSLYCASGAAALATSKSEFDLRQKWESSEVNCIQITNPTPGAVYRPGYFVRMKYGTQFCSGSNAAGPWTIHLYNNLKKEDNGVVSDYHEVIAENLDENTTQFLWNIPTDHLDKTKHVRERSEYFVRIETTSHDGQRLVGNAGPFAIFPDHGMKKRRQHEGIPGQQDETTFTPDPAGRPFVQFTQKTRRAVPSPAPAWVQQGQEADTEQNRPPATPSLVPGPPAHMEIGFIRMPPITPGQVELSHVEPNGLASVEVGTVKGTTIEWKSQSVIRPPTGKKPHVTEFTRRWAVDPQAKTFSYVFSMATEDTPLQPHLEAVLRKSQE
ncbi:THAP domain-containing protein 4 [Actinomortierella ambigua]|nr:THAP domain-containing protein 4 [Actinomortierella ambigua]